MVRVVFCCNSAYLDMTKVSIHSLRKLHPDAEVWLFTIGVDAEEVKELDVHLVPYKEVEYFQDDTSLYSGTFLESSLLRLVAMDYFKEKFGTGRFLYVDSDTLFLKRIDELWDIDLHGTWLGAVEELFDKHGHTSGKYVMYDHNFRHKLRFSNFYFNSGVLLFDLEKMPTGIYQHYLDRDPVARYIFKDQDCLNEISPRYLRLPISYNAFYNFYYDKIFTEVDVESERKRLRESHIVHILGYYKPHHKDVPITKKACSWPLKEYLEIATEIEEYLPEAFMDNLRDNVKRLTPVSMNIGKEA